MIAERIAELLLAKIDFDNDAVEAQVEKLTTSALNLQAAAAAVENASGSETFEDVANGIVDLADIFDDADLGPAATEKVEAVFSRIFSAPTEELTALGKDLFKAALEYGTVANETNQVFNNPNEEAGV